MYCPECGTDAGDAKFCPQCGADLRDLASDPTCDACGSDIAEGAKFCPECGEPTGRGGRDHRRRGPEDRDARPQRRRPAPAATPAAPARTEGAAGTGAQTGRRLAATPVPGHDLGRIRYRRRRRHPHRRSRRRWRGGAPGSVRHQRDAERPARQCRHERELRRARAARQRPLRQGCGGVRRPSSTTRARPTSRRPPRCTPRRGNSRAPIPVSVPTTPRRSSTRGRSSPRSNRSSAFLAKSPAFQTGWFNKGNYLSERARQAKEDGDAKAATAAYADARVAYEKAISLDADSASGPAGAAASGRATRVRRGKGRPAADAAGRPCSRSARQHREGAPHAAGVVQQADVAQLPWRHVTDLDGRSRRRVRVLIRPGCNRPVLVSSPSRPAPEQQPPG